jgi:hypothetical protein
MWMFNTPKCPIHKKPYKIGKDYMCQQYYYCYDCARDAKDKKETAKRIEQLEKSISQLEKIKTNE